MCEIHLVDLVFNIVTLELIMVILATLMYYEVSSIKDEIHPKYDDLNHRIQI